MGRVAVYQYLLRNNQELHWPCYIVSIKFYQNIKSAREEIESVGPEFTVIERIHQSIVDDSELILELLQHSLVVLNARSEKLVIRAVKRRLKYEKEKLEANHSSSNICCIDISWFFRLVSINISKEKAYRVQRFCIH